MATTITPVAIRDKVRTRWSNLKRDFPELAKKKSREKFDGFCQLMYDRYGCYLDFAYQRGKFKGMISNMIWDLKKKEEENPFSELDSFDETVQDYLQQNIRRYKRAVARYNEDPDSYSY